MLEKLFTLPFGLLQKIYWEAKYQGLRKKYDIDPSFKFNGEGSTLYGNGKIILGANSYIGRYSSIQSDQDCIVKIGNNCSISHYFMIYTENYISNQIFNGRDKAQIRKGNVIIGNGCWIGAYVFIREGVTIGDNVVVGAHSVVTKNIPSYSVAVGVPARVVKKISH